MNMRIAAIDIGTNTILMLIAEVRSDGTINIITDHHQIARLGKGVDEHRIIQEETFHRVLGILREQKVIAQSHSVEHIVVCGTSALRDSVNAQDFIDFVRQNIGLDIQVISGQKEAELTYHGVISDYYPSNSAQSYAVVDIGGGSTELITGSDSEIKSYASIDIGSVRLTERFLKKSPPSESAINNSCTYIHNQLKSLPPLHPDVKLIGVAGTLTTLAALDLHLAYFDPYKVDRHVLTLDTINRIFDDLKLCTYDQLKGLPQIHPLRADIILAGILILREILTYLRIPRIIVSVRGLRHGLLLNHVKTVMKNT